MPRSIWDRRTELRIVGEGGLSQMIVELEFDWKRVMMCAPLDPRLIDHDKYELKYTEKDMSLIEKHAMACGRNAAAVFLEEWWTSGRVRPSLETLQKLVTKLGLYGPMLQMAQLLGDPEPARPQKGPGAIVPTSITAILNQEHLEKALDEMDTVRNSQLAIDATYNNNIDIPCNSANGKSKEFPMFAQIPALCSTRKIVISDMIQFSQDVKENNNSPVEMLSNDLPIMLNQQTFQTVFPKVSFPIQSETNDDLSSSRDSTDQSIPDMPVIVSSLNRSSNENVLSGINYKYADLKEMTRAFADDSDVSRGIGGLIGKGGFGAVYVGFNLNRQPIAIKRLQAENIDTKMLSKQFQAEVEMAHFRHVNIVQVLGYSTDGPEKIIVSEYIHGGNLLINLSEKTLDQLQRFRVVSGTANGLQYLHCGTEKKIIHKDVKSANILLTIDCTPKLCDFGLSRMQDTRKTELIGTSAYIAPEVYRHDITPKMDVYSFGIVLLEILTGREPVITDSPGCTRNIQTFVMEELMKRGGERNDITPLLDSLVAGWPIANSLYDLATQCLAERNSRPDSSEVCKRLQRLNVLD